MALFQMAAISLTLRERVSGFKEAILHFPYSTIFHAVRNALHWCLLPFVAQLRCVVSCSQKLYILPDMQKEWVFFLPFQAPAFRDKSLVMLIDFQKQTLQWTTQHKGMEGATAKHSCTSQPRHWKDSSGFGCAIRDAIKVLICRKLGVLILPWVSAPSWASPLEHPNWYEISP